MYIYLCTHGKDISIWGKVNNSISMVMDLSQPNQHISHIRPHECLGVFTVLMVIFILFITPNNNVTKEDMNLSAYKS